MTQSDPSSSNSPDAHDHGRRTPTFIRAVIFDLDDTLYLEKDYVMSGYNAVAAYLSDFAGLNRHTLFNTLEAEFHRGRHDRNFETLLSRFGLSNPVEQLVEIYRKHSPTLKLPADSRRALRWTSTRYRLGMITDGRPDTQNRKIDALGIRRYFEKIVINNLTEGHSKYEVDSFYEMLAHFAVSACEAVYVGDNLRKDFIWPVRLGMSGICVQRPGNLYRDVPCPDCTNSAIAKVSSLDAIVSLLDVV